MNRVKGYSPINLSKKLSSGISNRDPLKLSVWVLLVTFGSALVVATVKVTALPVVLVGMTITLIVLDAFDANPPGTLHDKLPPVLLTAGMLEQLKPLVVTDWNLAFAGKVAASVTILASPVPALFTVKLMVKGWFTTTLFKVLILATKSITDAGGGVAVALAAGTAVGVK